MRFLFLIVLLVCSSASSTIPVEKYYITFIKGKAVLATTQHLLKVGDVLTAEDKILFDSKSSKISCINAAKGRFDLQPLSSKSGNEQELYAILKSGLIPTASSYSLSTRSIVFEGNDPVLYFAAPETQGRVLILEREPFLVKATYKMDDSNFFFIQFEENGGKTTKRISQKGRYLIFSKDTFSTNKGAPAAMVSLCYQSLENGQVQSTILVDFHPILTTSQEIRLEVGVIRKISGAKDSKHLKSAIINHIFENYGKIGAEELSLFL